MEEFSIESSNLSWTTAVDDEELINTSWSSHCKFRISKDDKENRVTLQQRKLNTYTEHVKPCGTIFSTSPPKDVDCNCLRHMKNSSINFSTGSWSSLSELEGNQNEVIQQNPYKTKEKSVHFALDGNQCYTQVKKLWYQSEENYQELHKRKPCLKQTGTLVKPETSREALLTIPLDCQICINSSQEKYACHNCSIKFEHNHAFQLHIRSTHHGFSRIFKPAFGCGQCGAKFFRNKYLRSHLVCHHHTLVTPTKK